MKTFQILQIIVLSYSVVVAIFVIFSTVFEFRNRFKPVQAKIEMFSVLNKFHGKHLVLNLFRLYSITFMLAWLILALPLIDLLIGTNYVSYFGTSPEGFTTLITYLGTFVGKQGDYYFLTVFVSIIGVKGFGVIKRMTDVLKSDTLAVGMTGMWGARKDFRKI